MWAYGAPVGVLHPTFQPKDAMEASVRESRGRKSAQKQHGDDWQWMAGESGWCSTAYRNEFRRSPKCIPKS